MEQEKTKQRTIVEKVAPKQCVGCMACGDACPVKAISYPYADDGFWLPQIDGKLCIRCGKCANVCPALSEPKEIKESALECYGVWNKTEQIRFESTSGGFFPEVASMVLDNGGYVVGAVYGEDFAVQHLASEESSDMLRMKQSKYAQSDAQGIYKTVKGLLDSEKVVFFTGTPCQVEALYCYLGKDYENLITLDFICCGISSPIVFKEYLRMLSKKYGAPVSNVWFKNKTDGWKEIGTRVTFTNGKKYFRRGNRDPYMISFVGSGFNIRNSCFTCRYRKKNHSSDFTVGDFWGIEKLHPEYDDNKGTTALIINTPKGKELFAKVKERVRYFETTVDEIAQGNFTLTIPKLPNADRESYLSEVQKKGILSATRKYTEYRGLVAIKRTLSYHYHRFLNHLRK